MMSEQQLWRECPDCHGVEILQGHPTFPPNTRFVHFILAIDGFSVTCSNCGRMLPAQ